MPRLQIRKNWLLLISCSLLGCAPESSPAPVYCHAWTKAEKSALYEEDTALPAESALHGLVRDYERVCGDLKEN